MPESAVHLRVRTALFMLLDSRLKGKAYVGSDQFVYFDSVNPRECLAPDVFVRLGGPFTLPRSFKIWEHGAPQLAVEIVSPTDARDRQQAKRLDRYKRSGILEVVIFDAEAVEPLRLWDRVEGDLVERDRTGGDWTRCDALGAYWFVQRDAELGLVLRLADNADGSGLWLTAEEMRAADRAVHEAERAAQAARIAELEAELARRGG